MYLQFWESEGDTERKSKDMAATSSSAFLLNPLTSRSRPFRYSPELSSLSLISRTAATSDFPKASLALKRQSLVCKAVSVKPAAGIENLNIADNASQVRWVFLLR